MNRPSLDLSPTPERDFSPLGPLHASQAPSKAQPVLSALLSLLLITPWGCGRREAAPVKQSTPAASPASPAAPSQASSETKIEQWVDPQAPLMLRWRLPHRDADLLTDLFALPARAATLYKNGQDRIRDTERFLGAPLRDPQLLSQQMRVGQVSLIRLSPEDFDRAHKALQNPDLQLRQHYEWRCVDLPAHYAQSLCLLDKPDLAWVDRRSQAQALEALRVIRDLPASGQRRALEKAWSQPPAPSALLLGHTPSLHFELEQDPQAFTWELFEFGRPGPSGQAGWRGHLKMQHPAPGTAVATLRKAHALDDHPKAQTLRKRAHVGQLGPQALEIRLELHGDDPAMTP